MADPPRTFRPPSKSHTNEDEDRSITPPNRPAVVDPRRQTGSTRHPTPLDVLDPLVSRELERRLSKLRNDMREEMAGMTVGIEGRIDVAVGAAVANAMRPVRDELHGFVRRLDDERADRTRYREAQTETLDAVNKALGVRKAIADTKKSEAEADAYPGESRMRRRAPVLAVCGVVVAALVALVSTMLNSHH